MRDIALLHEGNVARVLRPVWCSKGKIAADAFLFFYSPFTKTCCDIICYLKGERKSEMVTKNMKDMKNAKR